MILYTDAKVSPVGKVNVNDLRKIARDTLIFFAAPILIYLLSVNSVISIPDHVFAWSDFVPSATALGAIEGWFISILINFFLKLRDGKK